MCMRASRRVAGSVNLHGTQSVQLKRASMPDLERFGNTRRRASATSVSAATYFEVTAITANVRGLDHDHVRRGSSGYIGLRIAIRQTAKPGPRVNS